MTVGSSLSKAGPFIADGVQKEFPYEFSLLDPTHIAVWVDGSRILKGFTVTQNSVVFTEAPAEGSKVTLIRDVPFTQETDIQNNTAFFPEVIEKALDKLTMISQQLKEKSERSLTLLPGEGGADLQSFIERVSAAETAAATAETAAEQTERDSAFVREALQKSAGLPIGAVFAYQGATPPEGAYLLNGQTIANCRELYPKFWEWVTTAGVRSVDSDAYETELSATGVCGGFVINSANGSVRLPSVVDGTLWGADISNIGQSLAAGLPNITGEWQAVHGTYAGENNYFNVEGAIKHIASENSRNGKDVRGNTSSTAPGDRLGFDASRSNSIYGNSDTVQPPAIRVSWCIQVYNATTSLSEQEAAHLASLLQVKAGGDNIRKEAAMRVWESEEQTITNSTLYQLTHNLNLTEVEIRKARARILLKCVVAEHGYQAGDIISDFSEGITNQGNYSVSPAVRSNTIQFRKGPGSLIVIPLSEAYWKSLSNANWKMIFQIFY